MAGLGRHNIGGVCAAIGGILIHLTLGNLYSFGNMMTYMVSYMHERVGPTITYANFPWVMSITTMSQGFFMVLGGLLEKRIGPRLTCLLGCSLLSAGIMLTSLTVKVSLFAVTLTYGLLAGLGISLSYATPLSCGMQWFPGHKGLINGLIVAGFGLGALGSTTLQTMYLNPDNLSPQDNGGLRFVCDVITLDNDVTAVRLSVNAATKTRRLWSMLLLSPSHAPSNSKQTEIVCCDR